MFGGIKTADQIVASFTKTISQLEATSKYFNSQAEAHKRDIAESQANLEAAVKESARAEKLANKLNRLFGEDE